MPFTKFFLLARNLFKSDYTDISKSRKSLERAARLVPTNYKDFQISKVQFETFDGEWIIPNQSKNRVILYLHGGGYLIGSTKTHRPMVSRIASESESKALLINYRLAPENPYPAALEDAVSAYQYLLKEGYTPEQIIIAGDSAGGGLSVSLLYYLKDHQLPLPKTAVLLCPWTDLELTGPSIEKNSKYDPVLSRDHMEFMRSNYAGKEDFKQPYISPLYGDVQGLPPIYIQTGTIDPIYDDSVRLHEKILASGGNSILDIYPGKFHVWQAFYTFIREGKKAISEIAKYIKNQYN